MKAAIQFAAAVRVLAPAAAVTVFAQPSGPGISKEIGHMRLFVEPLFFSAV